MKYILITKLGKIMIFNVKACAELYQVIDGGIIVQSAESEVNAKIAETVYE